MATAGKAARNRQQVFYTDLTTVNLLIGQRTITCTLSRLMRTVKDTLSLGNYVFLLNTPCSPDTSFRAPTYHDSADIPRSWDRRTEYFCQQLSPYRPFWTSHRCANRDFGPNSSSSLCLQWTKSSLGTAGPSAPSVSPSKPTYQVSMPSRTIFTLFSSLNYAYTRRNSFLASFSALLECGPCPCLYPLFSLLGIHFASCLVKFSRVFVGCLRLS